MKRKLGNGENFLSDWLQRLERERRQEPDLVFVCPCCGLKMPWIPMVNGKKQCPRCGDSLRVVRTCYVPIEESEKLAENLEKLLSQLHVPVSRKDWRQPLPSGEVKSAKGDVE